MLIEYVWCNVVRSGFKYRHYDRVMTAVFPPLFRHSAFRIPARRVYHDPHFQTSLQRFQYSKFQFFLQEHYTENYKKMQIIQNNF